MFKLVMIFHFVFAEPVPILFKHDFHTHTGCYIASRIVRQTEGEKPRYQKLKEQLVERAAAVEPTDDVEKVVVKCIEMIPKPVDETGAGS